ncbi:MAG: AbgT family transporter [Clostridia bacterium]|nr:AbgT family transporter [Clostridiales bacterium]
MNTSTEVKKTGGFVRFINAVEKAGNKLPHPFFLFVYLMVIVLALSALMSGVSVTYTAATSGGGEMQETTVAVKNLLDAEYIKSVLKGLVGTYTGFAPLGLVMVMMLAIGFAQDTGLFNAFMKRTLLGAPPVTITFMLAIIGVCANLASNAGIVFGATIGAALFASLGRNPILGAVTGYAAAHGGFGANLILSGTDVLVSGITKSAAEGMGISAPTNPMINYFFMIVATFVAAITITFVTERVMPKIMKFGGVSRDIDETVTNEEKRGLKFAGIALIIFLVIMLALTVPSNAFFRAEDGTLVPSSPLIDSVVAVLFIAFVVVGSAYGVGSGAIKKQSDIPKFMGNGLKGSISFFVVAFPASLFIQFFNASKLANILAVKGAELLQSINFTGIPLAIAFIILCGFCNLFMTSGSSKWLILAPIFVPMFSVLGFSPALTQIAYRIGDSITNPIAPINYFLPIILGIMNQYKRDEDPEIGMGTLISMTLPFSMALAVTLTLQLIIWMLLGLPLGPGAGIYL